MWYCLTADRFVDGSLGEARWQVEDLAQALVRFEKRLPQLLEESARRAAKATGSNSTRWGLSNQSCGGSLHLRDRHGQKGLLPHRGLARHYGRLDPGAPERAAEECHQAAAQSRRPEAHRARLGDQGEKRSSQEVLVCAARQDVSLLQGSGRDGKQTFDRYVHMYIYILLTVYITYLWQNPLGQINMRDARVEEVEHVSDSDSEEREDAAQDQARLTVAIYPAHQGPTYLILSGKPERDNWLYHLTVVSGGGPSAGTQYEQLVQKLMETDGDPSKFWMQRCQSQNI